MNEWTEHFLKQMGGVITKKSEKTENEEKIEKNNDDEITAEEIEETIKNLKKKKAAGEDKIRNEAWIYGGKEVMEDLKEVMNKIWNGEHELPKEWKTGIIKPIFKKGDRAKAENYRGITLMSTGYKIYAEILRKRLERELEDKNVLGETQLGYRKNKGTIDAIYVTKTAFEEETKKDKGEIFMFFADMKGAFDKIKRNKIWQTLEKLNINNKLRHRIAEIYKETYFKIEINGEQSELITTEEGVRQGCPLSTTLFNVAFTNLEEIMSKVQEGGVVIGKRKIWSVSYADDIVLLANNEIGLK